VGVLVDRYGEDADIVACLNLSLRPLAPILEHSEETQRSMEDIHPLSSTEAVYQSCGIRRSIK
jgi:hypothetical protein